MGQTPDLPMLADALELQALLETDWPAHRASLLRSGLPLGLDPDPDEPDPVDPDPDDPDPGDVTDHDPKTFDAAYVKKIRGEAARYRREAREATARAKEFEDRDKTEAQKLEERATGAEQRAKAAELDLARTRVALRKGLTEQQAKRLIGETEEQLEADADDLLASFTQESDVPDASRRPRERLRPGAVPAVEPEETDPAKLAAQVPRRYQF